MNTIGNDVSKKDGMFGGPVFELFNESTVTFGEAEVKRIVFVVGSEKVGCVDVRGTTFPVVDLDKSGKQHTAMAFSYDISV